MYKILATLGLIMMALSGAAFAGLMMQNPPEWILVITKFVFSLN
jgi:hypothetical protein